MNQPLGLRGEQLTVGYGPVSVLRATSFAAGPSQVVAVLGRNGAGKSTLLRALSGVVRPSRGRLVLDGRDVTGTRPHALARAGVCHIPAAGGVFRNLSVAENVRMFAAPGIDDHADRVRAVAPDLVRWWHRPAAALSGGYQQLLALTRVYLTPARYVLLDEITTGLAPTVVDDIFTLVHGLRSEGRGVVLVEHDISRARDVADVMYVLRDGAPVFVGPPDELDDDALAQSYLGVRDPR